MDKKSVLIVGGTFDRNGGKPSGLINKIYEFVKNREDIKITLHNGGFVSELQTSIIEKCKENNIVFWMPNVSNDEEKIRNVKEVNPKTILISSKRNDGNKYSFAELISRALAMKSNLTIEFRKVADKKFNMMVFDPLGNEYYNGTDIEKMSKELFDRAVKLTTFTRCPSIKVEDDNIPEVPNEEEFFQFARSCSDIFHNLINPSKDTNRFLGNMSFRCQEGFPSFRGDKNIVFVSQRNVNKTEITKDSFVATYLDENKNVRYYGDKKPSVDTPVQLRLYELYPQMNYMIHAHCYFEMPSQINTGTYSAYTYNRVPCGAIEEVKEIQNVLLNEVYDSENHKMPELVAVNLSGHGCILMAQNVSAFTKLMKHKNSCFIKRPVPENIIKDLKNDTLSIFSGRKKGNFKFTNNNLHLEEFKQAVYNSTDLDIGMVEDEYCCHGVRFNCWEEVYGVGIWNAKRKDTNKTLIEVYKYALENHPDRIFTARRSGRIYVAIVTRDITKSDYRIYL